MSHSAVIHGCDVLPPMEPRRPRKPACAAPIGKGRFAVLNTFVDATLRSLSGTAAKVWFILYRDTKPNGLVAASDTELGRRAGVTARSIFTARKQLESLCLLEVVRRGGLATGASVYRVRPLTAEARFRLTPEADCIPSRKRASDIPQEDQKGCPDPFGSDTRKKKKERGAGGGA